jgi:hypothetical protein
MRAASAGSLNGSRESRVHTTQSPSSSHAVWTARVVSADDPLRRPYLCVILRPWLGLVRTMPIHVTTKPAANEPVSVVGLIHEPDAQITG